MMLALSGLHGSGKSHLSALIASGFGWDICVKRDLLKLLHISENITGDWVVWYRTLYAAEGAYEVTRKLMGFVPARDRIILDSVHNLTEWRAVRSLRPDAILASVIAPKAVRAARNGSEDPGLDIQRILFWHGDKESASCLAAESEWCFNGAASAEVQRTEFEAFLDQCTVSTKKTY